MVMAQDSLYRPPRNNTTVSSLHAFPPRTRYCRRCVLVLRRRVVEHRLVELLLPFTQVVDVFVHGARGHHLNHRHRFCLPYAVATILSGMVDRGWDRARRRSKTSWLTSTSITVVLTARRLRQRRRAVPNSLFTQCVDAASGAAWRSHTPSFSANIRDRLRVRPQNVPDERWVQGF